MKYYLIKSEIGLATTGINDKDIVELTEEELRDLINQDIDFGNCSKDIELLERLRKVLE